MYRLLEICHPVAEKNVKEILKNVNVIDMWEEKHGKQIFTKVLLLSEETENAIKALQRHYSKYKDFRVVILSVEATIPRIEEETEEKKEEKERLSMEEIYEDLMDGAKISISYITLVILASIVAAIGILYHDVAVVIGSMVIAPLLAPNMALAMAATLADWKLAKHAMTTSFIGYSIAIAIGIIFGLIFSRSISLPNLSLLYVLLAFSAGIAGSISISKGVTQAIVGVMVAVALLPPIVASGIFMGQHHLMEASGTFLLFSINVVSINLAAIITFLAQGISPRTWWERKKAKKTVWLFIAIWLFILLALIILVYIYQRL